MPSTSRTTKTRTPAKSSLPAATNPIRSFIDAADLAIEQGINVWDDDRYLPVIRAREAAEKAVADAGHLTTIGPLIRAVDTNLPPYLEALRRWRDDPYRLLESMRPDFDRGAAEYPDVSCAVLIGQFDEIATEHTLVKAWISSAFGERYAAFTPTPSELGDMLFCIVGDPAGINAFIGLAANAARTVSPGNTDGAATWMRRLLDNSASRRRPVECESGVRFELCTVAGLFRASTIHIDRHPSIRSAASDAQAAAYMAASTELRKLSHLLDEVPTAPQCEAPAGVAMTETQCLIVAALRDAQPRLLNQVDIAARINRGRDTTGKEMKSLEDRGIVHRPKGKRRGYALK